MNYWCELGRTKDGRVMIHRCNRWTGCGETFYDENNHMRTWNTEAEAVAWLKQNYPDAIIAENPNAHQPPRPRRSSAKKWEQPNLFEEETKDEDSNQYD